jgi:hypothetical protein
MISRRIALLCVGVAVSLGAVGSPNAVVAGSRPVPYGFYIPADRVLELGKHHALPGRWDARYLSPDAYPGFERVREFHERLGDPLPDVVGPRHGVGAGIWLPPREETENSRSIWIHSWHDGWIVPETAGRAPGQVSPTHSHAAFDSGAIGIRLFAVPLSLHDSWCAFLRAGREDREAFAEELAGAKPELRASLERYTKSQSDPAFSFHFSQWAHERSKVARIMVSLPIGEVDGELRFTETPTVHWFDAYGKETPPHVPEPASPVLLVLVAASGGALLAYALLSLRRRAAAAAG